MIDKNDFNDVECELISSGYNSLEISNIWKNKKLLNKIIDGIVEARNMTQEELLASIKKNKK